jgi:hypothetical protein
LVDRSDASENMSRTQKMSFTTDTAQRDDEGGMRKEERRKRKEEGRRRKEDGRRMKDEGRRKEVQ